MPDLSKSAITLLQNLDLESVQQIQPQQLESLIATLQKSHVPEKTEQSFRTSKLALSKAKNQEILKLRNLGQTTVPPAVRPEYEMESKETFPAFSALKNSLDLSSSFTVPEKILGPFKTIDGLEMVINFYRYIDDFKILFPGETQAAVIMPARLQRIVLAGTRVSTLTLGKGSVWIRADLLDPNAPKEKYIGLCITSGSVKLGGNFSLGSNSVQIPKNSPVECEFNLNNSYQPKNTDPYGNDGKNSVFTPSALLKLKSTNSRFRVTGNGNYAGKTLGQEIQLTSLDNTFEWDGAKNNMMLSLTSRETQFSVYKSESKLYQLQGRCKVGNYRWMLASRVLQNNQSIEVKFNGALTAMLSPGLHCKWDGIREADRMVTLNECQLLFMSGLLHIGSENADFASLQDRMKLWQHSTEYAEKMELHVRFADYRSLQIISQGNEMDMVSTFADTDFYINKPLLADNRPVHPKSRKSMYAKGHSKSGKVILILDSDMLTEDQVPGTNAPLRKYQFALQNAYFTTTEELGLFLNAKYESENIVYEGSLLLQYGIYHVLPTLPHPYTANRHLHQKTRVSGVSGVFQSIIEWSPESGMKEAKVTFKMNRQFSEQSSTLNTSAIVNSPRYKHQELRMSNNFMLFDVSTESDHWGVAFSLENREIMRKLYSHDVNVTDENVVTIHKNYLQTPMGFMHGLTLPHISWEPVANITPKDHNLDPPAGVLDQKNNSVPTVFTQLYNKPVKIHPRNYMEAFRQTLKSPTDESKNLQSKILFTLPNGKLSVVSLNPYSQEKMWQKGHLDFIMPKFEHQSQSLTGGLQFRISAFKDPNPDQPPRMRGKTEQLYNLTDFPDISILGQSVTTIFNESFNKNQEVDIGIPITHIDFSGYGASTFSNWQNPTAKFASIAQAKFDVLKGRTAYELVQAVSVIYPWGICTSRTVTFLRNNNAVIFREDSGWVAKGDGLFDFSFHWPTNNATVFYPNIYDIYPGLVQGLFNVSNIKEDYNDIIKFSYDLQNGDFSVNNSVLQTNASGTKEAEFVAVYFDADVKLDPLDTQVTGKRFKGYLQLKPQGVPVPARILRQILNKSQNPVSGGIDTLLPIERTLQKFKSNAVEVNPSYQNDNAGAITFVASVKGSVILPPDGSWSVVQVDKSSGVVQNLKTGSTVGLVKDGLRPKNHGNAFQLNTTKTLVAFPDGLKNSLNSFSKTYGFLQNTETQKLLLNSVQYIKGQADKYSTDPALLADSFRLLNSKGPFPNLSEAIKVDNAAQTVIDLLPDGAVSGGVKKIFNYEVPPDFNYDIIGKQGDAFRIYINYNAVDKNGNPPKKSVIKYVTDSVSEDRWSNQMQNLTVGVDLVFKPIMYISGDFGNGKKISAGLNSGSSPQLKLCKELQTIYDILEFLNNLDPSQPSEAVKKALKIVMSNSADSWEYKFKADKEIPLVKFPFDPVNYNSPTTPLKLDAFFRLGVYFNQPIKIPNTIDQLKPSVGAYLELGADLRVMCVSVAAATIYAVGRAEVGLAADLNTPPTLYFKFGFGVELAVGLPVIGSVAVMFMVGVDIKINSVDVIVGAFIYFRGRVEILGGIVTITISIEAAGQIHKKVDSSQPTNCIAKCTFALDISIAFVININFTETWEETRQIS
ncbi:hypothetical protein H1R16_06520 [Marnyiella aurantia]|uniref:Uncharacterized protein n=1 Tax=Marnyiella aurantia TaxID=2758037 RepID=A0A7D7LQ59_9FLAO|nr:hypothetical protein [Marnyiella aurantia]MBA5247819.1 hypothetical protein [Marnyiella aurantia]QMS97398.1 hypothetical protein H1R16_06520 [Marnyiella aurantia]